MGKNKRKRGKKLTPIKWLMALVEAKNGEIMSQGEDFIRKAALMHLAGPEKREWASKGLEAFLDKLTPEVPTPAGMIAEAATDGLNALLAPEIIDWLYEKIRDELDAPEHQVTAPRQ